MPTAELEVSADLVRRLIAAQHPDLAHLPVTVMANGWDNVLCRIGDRLLARLPRRALAAQLITHEQQWLPLLAPRLPIRVPAPVRIGRPALEYPWRWSIVPFLPGRPAAASPPSDLRSAALRLGRFLGALHIPAPPQAPANAFRGVPLEQRAETVAENLRLLDAIIDQAAVYREWQQLLATPAWKGPKVWLHADLHPANILIHRGAISAVIDFGDITSGDPATDLSVAWMFLPAEHHDAFRAEYAAAGENGADDDTWARARGWALALSVAFLAHSADNPVIAGIGRRTLAAVLGS